MNVTIASPQNGAALDDALAVVLRAAEGQMAVLRHHADFIGLVAPGPLRIDLAGRSVRGVVGAGVVRIEGGDVALSVDAWETVPAEAAAVEARSARLAATLADRDAHPAMRERARRELAFLEAWVAAGTNLGA